MNPPIKGWHDAEPFREFTQPILVDRIDTGYTRTVYIYQKDDDPEQRKIVEKEK